MITKRVRGRLFLLKPSKRTNQIVTYVLAVLCERYGIALHSVVALSNHWHLCLTDVNGRVVEFTRDCHALIARHINAAHGDFDNLWSSQQTSHVHCETPDDLVRKIAYCMANPVQARLVREGRHWPGLRRAWPAKPLTVKRPHGFFRDSAAGGLWPETAVLTMARPPGYDDLDDEELAALIDQTVAEREGQLRRAADEAGLPFLGRRAVRKASRYAAPSSPDRRFRMSPRVACRDKWARIERLARDRAWLDDYGVCRDRWTAGDRTVAFPYGTYKLRVVCGVRCRPPPGR